METSDNSVIGYKVMVYIKVWSAESVYGQASEHNLTCVKARNFKLSDEIPVSTRIFFNDDFRRSLTYPWSKRLFESRFALRIKHP